MTTDGISWKLKWMESVFLFPELTTGRPAGQHTGGPASLWSLFYQLFLEVSLAINRQGVGGGGRQISQNGPWSRGKRSQKGKSGPGGHWLCSPVGLNSSTGCCHSLLCEILGALPSPRLSFLGLSSGLGLSREPMVNLRARYGGIS